MPNTSSTETNQSLPPTDEGASTSSPFLPMEESAGVILRNAPVPSPALRPPEDAAGSSSMTLGASTSSSAGRPRRNKNNKDVQTKLLEELKRSNDRFLTEMQESRKVQQHMLELEREYVTQTVKFQKELLDQMKSKK